MTSSSNKHVQAVKKLQLVGSVLPSDPNIDYILVFTHYNEPLTKSQRQKFEDIFPSSDILTSRKAICRWIVQELRRRSLSVEEVDNTFWIDAASRDACDDTNFSTSFTVYKVMAPFATLCEEAESVGALKLLRPQPHRKHFKNKLLYKQYMKFNRVEAERGAFANYSADRSYFSISERQYFVASILHSLNSPSHRSILPLLANQDFLVYFPTHDNKQNNEIMETVLVRAESSETVDMIANYYGSEFGMYVAWLVYYVSWLVAPALVGLCVYVFVDSTEDVIQSDGSTKEVELMPPAMILYSIGICIWSTLFLSFWKREGSLVSFRWHVMQSVDPLLTEPRPEYGGSLRFSEITEREQVYSPATHRYKKYLFTFPVCVVFTCLCWVFMHISFELEELVIAYQGDTYFSGYLRFLNAAVPHVPTLFYAATLPLLSAVYTDVVHRLTEWENHRTSTEHENAVILKLMPFYFVNSYISLFYIAFIKMDIQRLRSQLATLMVLTQFGQNIVEVGLPLVSASFKIRRQLRLQTGKRKSRRMLRTGVMRSYEVEGQMPAYPGTFDEYLEMVCQFGYVTLFGWCWPLAAACALLNNIIEVRSDIIKLGTSFRKPPVTHKDTIGMWHTVLEFISVTSVITNFAFLGVYVFYILPRDYPPGVVSKSPSEWVWSRWLGDPTQLSSSLKLMSILAVEHGVLLLRYLLATLIPDKPRRVREAIAKQQLLSEQMLNLLRSFSESSFSLSELDLSAIQEQAGHSPLQRLSSAQHQRDVSEASETLNGRSYARDSSESDSDSDRSASTDGNTPRRHT